jgi:hypothetical protein
MSNPTIIKNGRLDVNERSNDVQSWQVRAYMK